MPIIHLINGGIDDEKCGRSFPDQDVMKRLILNTIQDLLECSTFQVLDVANVFALCSVHDYSLRETVHVDFNSSSKKRDINILLV